MAKYYKARVTLQVTFECGVIADTEEEAKAIAIGNVKPTNGSEAPSSSSIQGVALTLVSESKLRVGGKLKHPIFGIGEVLEIYRVTGGDMYPRTQEAAKIIFEDREVKNIVVGATLDRIEFIDA